MAAPDIDREYSLITKLIDRMKRLSEQLAELSELRSLDEGHIDQIAHEFGLSRSGLFSLCASQAGGHSAEAAARRIRSHRAATGEAVSRSVAGSAAGLRHLHDDVALCE